MRPPPTVVTFGDSTTAVRPACTVYTTLLEARFPQWRFCNRGIPGNTTEMARERFANDVLAERPARVVIQFGINDAAVDVWKTPPATDSRVSLERYGENLRYFVSEVCRTGGGAILMTPNPVWWTPELIEKYGKPPYDPADPLGFTRILARYAGCVREIAREAGVPLVDVEALYARWEAEQGRSPDCLLLDGMHPNTDGQALVADALAPVLKTTVC